MKKVLFALSFILVSLLGKATHIVGGEIYYDCLGNNSYRVTLKVYRDCFNGMAAYDNPASIGVFDMSGNLVENILIKFSGSNPVPGAITNPCLIPPANVCVEEAIYDTIVNLNVPAGGLNLVYQRCCRNQTILNLTNPGDVGATYQTHIPDPSLAPCNSSPRFNNFPPIFICADVPFTFDHSATDPDGDQLVYEFASPYHGASSLYPMPQPPNAPPYTNVPFIAPYSATYPMASNPAMNVDGVSGLLTGTPNMMGQWVVGVVVKEYRNGVLINQNLRDFQFNVVNCPNIPVSSIPAQTNFCFGMNVNFQNNSVNGSTWHWDFGDTTVTLDTSNIATPSWTYSTPGTYTVMLVVNPGTPCVDTGYTQFTVAPLLDPNFVPDSTQCFPGHSFDFNAAGAFQGNGTFDWNFGSNANPQMATAANVNGVTFNTPGVYPVTITVSENGCTKSYTDSVEVLDKPDLTFNLPPISECSPLSLQFSDSSFNHPSITSVLWSFGDGSVSTQMNPSHVYNTPGTYDVSLVINTNNVCLGNLTFNVPNAVTANPSPVAQLNATPTTLSLFDSTVTFIDQSQGASSCWIYYGDGDSSNYCGGTHTYPMLDNYTVTQVVENQYGCKDTYELFLDYDPYSIFWIPNAFTPNNDGKNEFFGPVAIGIENYQMRIFDRWGNMIFETTDLARGWDGTYKGQACQQDVYVWKVSFEPAGESRQQYRKVGHVTLVH